MARAIPKLFTLSGHLSKVLCKPQSWSRFAPLSQRMFSVSATDDKMHTIDEVLDMITNMVGTHTEWGSDEIIAGSDSVMQAMVDSQDQLPKKRPSDSYAQAVIPVGSDESVRDKYLTSTKQMRFGRLLEDFDTMAGMICYKHNQDPTMGLKQKSPYAFVTVMVDRIEVNPETPISATKDIYIEGNVTWVGSSSMECTMHMSQDVDNVRERLITAHYLFVSRNPVTRKAAVVSPLDPQTDEERTLYRMGEEHKTKRVVEGAKSLLKSAPSNEERLMIHDIFLSTADLQSGSLEAKFKPPNSVWMADTVVKTLIICHPEQRNLYNKIFGGFLMRKAYELAWTNACIYAKTQPLMCKIVDDILFLKPVEIGSLLFLSAQAVYTRGPDLQVKVLAEVVDPATGHHEMTNEFHFTFDTGVDTLARVVPSSYAEAMLYVDGKRHYES